MELNYESLSPGDSCCVTLADMKLFIDTALPLYIGRGLKNFIGPPVQAWEAGEEPVRIRIVPMRKTSVPGSRVLRGRDMLMEYYTDGEVWYCEAPGKYGPVTRTTYTEAFHEVLYEINGRDYPGHITSLDKVMQLFPLRQLLFSRKIFLLHSSQIILGGMGILFTGDSGAGKTTQARLWEKFRLAEVVCNDRTALRRKEGVWKTYGFSIDGSAPVYRPGVWTAAAVAVLSHGENNTVQSLSGLPAVRALLKQMVIDAWNPAMRSGMADRVIGMLTGIPVYRLVCTPDRQAVECLEQQLRKDGIL